MEPHLSPKARIDLKQTGTRKNIPAKRTLHSRRRRLECDWIQIPSPRDGAIADPDGLARNEIRAVTILKTQADALIDGSNVERKTRASERRAAQRPATKKAAETGTSPVTERGAEDLARVETGCPFVRWAICQ